MVWGYLSLLASPRGIPIEGIYCVSNELRGFIEIIELRYFTDGVEGA